MADYISREDVSRMILNYRADNPKKQTVWAMVISDMLRDLKEIPTADVQPVKRGEWEYCKSNSIVDTYKCTLCGEEYEIFMDIEPTTIYKYCPNCGARMDGDTECQ